MTFATVPLEAMLVIGLVTALGILSCLRIFGAELEHEVKLHHLTVKAHQVRLERQKRLEELQRHEQERADRFSAARQRALNLNQSANDDELVGVDILPEAA